MAFPTTHPALARALAARDYSVPTAVQTAVLAAEAEGRDLLVSAQTGSGKTVAFGLAFATTLLGSNERFERAAEPLALVIAPTRELAMQVHRELDWLFAETGARAITCVGGMDARAEARQLQSGAHIVVGTPGRLRDHLERKRLDLSKLKTIVLDEADEMLDLGFREDLEFILDATPPERQTLLFSATMPREIENMARKYQRDAIRIETVRRDEQHADIEYKAVRVVPNDVEHAVVNILRFHEMRAALVFCSTREAVKRLHSSLVERGFSAVALSGELSQAERTHALQALRDGRARVLVATDVAARGLDLPDLTLVIHADLPNDRETLLHRSGRTGRAGKKGLCMLIVPFNRRRKADVLLNAAKLKVTWGTAPSAEDIRAKDQERFLADAVFTEAATDEDVNLARILQNGKTAEEIALALVRMNRARLPAAEDLAEDTGPPTRPRDASRQRGPDAFKPRDDNARFSKPWKSDRDGDKPFERRKFEGKGEYSKADRPHGAHERGPRSDNPRSGKPRFDKSREDNRDMVWYRLNIGRERNADPKWLIPLICNAGGVTKAEIGSIKIHDRDTRFQIAAEFAEQFDVSVRTNKQKEGHIARVGANTAADDAPPAPYPSDAPATPHTPPPTHTGKPARHERADKSAPPGDGASKPHAKAPWQDRSKGKPAPYKAGPHKDGPHKGAPHKDGPHKASAPKTLSLPGGAPSNPKFKFKKKHRKGPKTGT